MSGAVVLVDAMVSIASDLEFALLTGAIGTIASTKGEGLLEDGLLEDVNDDMAERVGDVRAEAGIPHLADRAGDGDDAQGASVRVGVPFGLPLT